MSYFIRQIILHEIYLKPPTTFDNAFLSVPLGAAQCNVRSTLPWCHLDVHKSITRSMMQRQVAPLSNPSEN